MNRTIKFRAWDKERKEMREVLNLELPNSTENERIVAMQYTGLKDKNEVEIYEGDMVKFSIERYVQTSPMVADMFNIRLRLEIQDNYYRIDGDSLEVIGNIYENPKLLL